MKEKTIKNTVKYAFYIIACILLFFGIMIRGSYYFNVQVPYFWNLLFGG